jgi:hypothetical protein
LLFSLQPAGLPDAVTIASLEREYPGFSARNRTAAAGPPDLDFRDDFAPPLARQGPGAFEALFGKAERTILRS